MIRLFGRTSGARDSGTRVAGPKCEIVEIPTFSPPKTALPKIILEVKFTDGIEVVRGDAQAAAERLEARLRGWKMPTQ
jgi:hypothetical protein